MPVSLVFVGIGFFGYGHMMAIGASAYACATFQGLLTFGVVIGLTSSIAYGLDAYREMSNELFIMNMVMIYFLLIIANLLFRFSKTSC